MISDPASLNNSGGKIMLIFFILFILLAVYSWYKDIKLFKERRRKLGRRWKFIKDPLIIETIIVVLIVLIGLWILSPKLPNITPKITSPPTPENQIGSPSPTTIELFSELQVGMTALEVHKVSYSKMFRWLPPTTETKQCLLQSEVNSQIIVSFDNFTMKPIGGTPTQGAWQFTDAKVTKIELYYNGEKIAEK